MRLARLAAVVLLAGPWGDLRATAAETPAAGLAETPAGTAAPATPDPTARAVESACEKRLKVFVQRKPSAPSMSESELQKLGALAPDLITCSAILQDSTTACGRFMPMEQGPGKMCEHMRSMFSEMRAYPKGRSFMFDDVDWHEWQVVPELRAPSKGLRDALRSGNAKDCAQAGDLESICRAYLSGDKSLCKVTGPLATATVNLAKDGMQKIAPLIEEACQQSIESRALLTKGLKAVAESGPPREREFAKAALGEADACAPFLEQAIALCANSERPVVGTPVAGTPERPPPAMP